MTTFDQDIKKVKEDLKTIWILLVLIGAMVGLQLGIIVAQAIA